MTPWAETMDPFRGENNHHGVRGARLDRQYAAARHARRLPRLRRYRVGGRTSARQRPRRGRRPASWERGKPLKTQLTWLVRSRGLGGHARVGGLRGLVGGLARLDKIIGKAH